MSNESIRRQHLDAIIGELGRRFEGSVPQEDIVDDATMTYDDLCEHSRVEAFVPILALRRSRDHLSLKAAEAEAEAGFTDDEPEPRYELGDIARLVDGLFEITHVQDTSNGRLYRGRWVGAV
jgi:hypothetical protein